MQKDCLCSDGLHCILGAVAQSYQVILRYDGRAYHGWQRLKDHKSIQGTVELAIARALGESLAVQGAGRTDRGAHAEGQSAGFRLQSEVSEEFLVSKLNGALPDDISIIGARKVSGEFHVRENAIGKEYEYRIFVGEVLPKDLRDRVWHVHKALDVAAMTEAMSILKGTHDFASFATKTRFKKKSGVRELSLSELRSDGPMIYLRFGSTSFLNHMVRNLARAVVKVGEGRYSIGRFREILDAAERSASPGSAPASGLFLMNVNYPEE
jgi:tRNA pseudouridine38-40 synthase